MMRLRFVAEAAAVRAFLAAARVLPRSLLLTMGSATGMLWYSLDARHRRVAMGNLRRAYGSTLSTSEMRRIVRACWRHYGRTLFDTLAFGRFSADSAHTLVRYRGLEHIRAAYGRGRGVLLFSAHFGHWELVALMQGFLGMPLTMVTRPLDNSSLETRLRALRERSGNTIAYRRNAVREILATVRRGGGVAILIDQDARDGGIFVPFFGVPASTTPTLALVALRTGAAVVPVFSVPRSDGTYDVTYEPEVEVRDTGDREADVRRITESCTATIERWVRRNPELWLWMHRRWKTPAPSGVAGSGEHHAA
jgi:KDO2-lipid IV(A) lauroyltransferase